MNLWQDCRFAARSLAKSPGFTTVAVLSLALGVGAVTAIFSVVYGVLLQPLPYQDPERLVMVREVVPAMAHLYPELPVNAHHYLEWRRDWKAVAQIAIMRTRTANLTGGDVAEQLAAAEVSASLFPTLGVQPALGRGFLDSEDSPGRNHVVLLADSLWKRRFQGDPSIVGRSIQIDGAAHQVIGILPASYRYFRTDELRKNMAGSTKVEVFKPIALDVKQLEWEGDFNWGVIARLRPGVSPEQALSQLTALQSNINRFTREKMDLGARVYPLQQEITSNVKRGLWMLLAAVASVLLIVCVNLANLMLARSASRVRESSIRTALGATSWDLLRHTLAGGLILALIGGILGSLLAFAGVHFLLLLAPVDLPRVDEVGVNGAVLAFALAVSVLTGLLVSLLPARRMALAQPADSMKTGNLTLTEGRAGLRTRAILVSLEVGLSTALLVVAGLLLGSFSRLMQVDRGFEVEHLISFEVNPAGSHYMGGPVRAEFYRRLLLNLEQTPGVRSAGIINSLPLQGETWIDMVIRDAGKRPLFENPLANYRMVNPHYFATLGIALRSGRSFEETDRDRPVAVVSSRVAERVWPGQNPIGQRFHSGNTEAPPYEIVGVASDIRGLKLQSDPGAMVYVPYWNRVPRSASIVVRTAMDSPSMIPALRAALAGADKEIPMAKIRTMEQVVSESVGERRFQMWLVSAFAASALLLASLGIYGVLAYTVARRTRELGIRIAVGATAADLRRLVLTQGMAPVAFGLFGGLAAALALGRAIRGLLFGVSPAEPVVIVGVVLLLSGVALLACWLPARRASRLSPSISLRYE